LIFEIFNARCIHRGLIELVLTVYNPSVKKRFHYVPIASYLNYLCDVST